MNHYESFLQYRQYFNQIPLQTLSTHDHPVIPLVTRNPFQTSTQHHTYPRHIQPIPTSFDGSKSNSAFKVTASTFRPPTAVADSHQFVDNPMPNYHFRAAANVEKADENQQARIAANRSLQSTDPDEHEDISADHNPDQISRKLVELVTRDNDTPETSPALPGLSVQIIRDETTPSMADQATNDSNKCSARTPIIPVTGTTHYKNQLEKHISLLDAYRKHPKGRAAQAKRRGLMMDLKLKRGRKKRPTFHTKIVPRSRRCHIADPDKLQAYIDQQTRQLHEAVRPYIDALQQLPEQLLQHQFAKQRTLPKNTLTQVRQMRMTTIAPSENGFWFDKSYVRPNLYGNFDINEIKEIYRGRASNATTSPYYLHVKEHIKPEHLFVIPPLLYRPHKIYTSHPIWMLNVSGSHYDAHRHMPIFWELQPRKTVGLADHIVISVQASPDLSDNTPITICESVPHQNPLLPGAPYYFEASLNIKPWTRKFKIEQINGTYYFTLIELDNVNGIYAVAACQTACHYRGKQQGEIPWFIHVQAIVNGTDNIHQIIPVKSRAGVRMPTRFDLNGKAILPVHRKEYDLSGHKTAQIPPDWRAYWQQKPLHTKRHLRQRQRPRPEDETPTVSEDDT